MSKPIPTGCCAITGYGEVYEHYTDGLWYPDGEGEAVGDPEGVIAWVNREMVDEIAKLDSAMDTKAADAMEINKFHDITNATVVKHGEFREIDQ
jgi:hypothetical protein